MRTVKITILIVLVCLFLVVMWASTSMAGSNFTLIDITLGPTIDPLTPTPMPCEFPPYYWAWMGVSFLPDGNDGGSGSDWTAAVARLADGTVISVWYSQSPTNSTLSDTNWYRYFVGAPGIPFTGTPWLEVYDITYAATAGGAPGWEFNRIIANSPTPVIRVKFNAADILDPNCPQSGPTGDDSAPLPPDERLNWQQGDLMAVVYAASDSSGAPAMHIYTVNDDSRGTFLASVTQADIAPYRDTPPPAANTVIKTLGENVILYRLVSGEFALVIGPDMEGKNWQIIFDDIPWTYLKHEDFDPGA